MRTDTRAGGRHRSPRVAVVGGGVSGLVAARDLALAGCEVTLLEADERLGGRIRSVVVRGSVLGSGSEAGEVAAAAAVGDLADEPSEGPAFDMGAEAFANRGGAVAELLDELGLADEIVPPAPLGSWVVTGDRSVPLPASGMLGIPASPLSRASFRALGITGALRAAVEPLLPRSVGMPAAPAPGASASTPGEGDPDGQADGLGSAAPAPPTVGALVRSRLGSRVLDRLVRPVALGVHSTDPDELSLDAMPGIASAFERSGSLTVAARELRRSAGVAGGAVSGLRDGMTVLVDALAAELERLGVGVELGSPVQHVAYAADTDGAVAVTIGGARGDDKDESEGGLEDSADPPTEPLKILPRSTKVGSAVRSRREAAAVRTVDVPRTAALESSSETRRFDGAVIAVPEAAARSMLGLPVSEHPDDLVEIIALVLDDEQLDQAPRGTGALVAPPAPGSDGGAAPIRAKALTHVTAKWAARARDFGPGRHVLRLSYGRLGQRPETLDLSDDSAQRLALEDASRILGLELSAISLRGMARSTWRMGAPLAARTAGRSGEIAGTRIPEGAVPLLKALPSGIAVAGDWVSGTGLASVIPGARRAAEAVLNPAPASDRRAVLGSEADGPTSRAQETSDTAASEPNTRKGIPTMVDGPDDSPNALPPLPPPVAPGATATAPEGSAVAEPRSAAGSALPFADPPQPPPGRVVRAEGRVAAAPGLLRIGTRGSALAVTQTTTVAQRIADATGLDVALVIVTTKGDTSRAPLAQLGGTGVFVSALRDALLAGECDLAVHSLKDLPTGAHPEIVLGAIPERADARDALCARDGLRLDELPEGAKIGTGSPRRAAQILSRRSDVEVLDLRGNVDTRLGRVGDDLDAVVLAAAGLDRLGRDHVITERFSLEDSPTAPGQGALAVEVRAHDAVASPYLEALAALDDARARACALAERSLLAALEAGCAAPIGARAAVVGDRLGLVATVYSLDGAQQLTAQAEMPWASDPVYCAVPERLGRIVCDELLARGAAQLAPLGGAR